MCGIIGKFSKAKNIDKKNAMAMHETLKHRGPDDCKTYFEKKVFLGHHRLSIQDLSPKAKQPMWDSEKKTSIVYNGEIYNFKSIRDDLAAFKFKSQSDTEVILYAYKKWGIKKAIEKFNGMFAFCIFDKKKNKAFLVRDRIGIKPLLYYWDKENLVFSSELKALAKSKLIKKEINKEAIMDYFVHRYVPHPKTIYKNIHKLEPGHYLELDLKTFKLSKKKYWDLKPERDNSKSEEELIQEIETILKDSVSLRLISDTPVASFLSGGIDSSLITTLAKNQNQKLQAFTIDLQPEKYSEAEYARLLASKLNINTKFKTVGRKEFHKEFSRLLNYYDEPFADSSMIPTTILCKFVRNNGYKCALSGDGGDEIFYGYSWYKYFNMLEKMKFLKVIPKTILKLFEKHPKLWPLSLFMFESLERYRRLMYNRFTVKEVNQLFGYSFDLSNDYFLEKKHERKRIKANELNFLDFKTFLVDDILHKVDIASMSHSLEVRVPFLDHRLVELMFTVAFRQLYRNGKLKYLLKCIAKNRLPEEIIKRKKKGFSAPVAEWIGDGFQKELKQGKLIKHGLINENALDKLLKEKNMGKIWLLYMFEKWFSTHGLNETTFSDKDKK